MAIELKPDDPQTLYNLGRALDQLHKPEAKQYVDRFQALAKSRQLTDRVQQLNNFALSSADARDWPQAVDQLKEALRLGGQCPQRHVLHKNLGLIYARKGDIKAGERELRMALEKKPDDQDVLKAIEILQALQNKPTRLDPD